MNCIGPTARSQRSSPSNRPPSLSPMAATPGPPASTGPRIGESVDPAVSTWPPRECPDSIRPIPASNGHVIPQSGSEICTAPAAFWYAARIGPGMPMVPSGVRPASGACADPGAGTGTASAARAAAGSSPAWRTTWVIEAGGASSGGGALVSFAPVAADSARTPAKRAVPFQPGHERRPDRAGSASSTFPPGAGASGELRGMGILTLALTEAVTGSRLPLFAAAEKPFVGDRSPPRLRGLRGPRECATGRVA